MDYRNLAYQTAQKYGLDPDMFVRQIQAESAFNPAAISSAGAIGLGQLMPATAKALGVDPTDPVQNLEGAARYMKQQLDRFGDPALALAAYNAGPSRVAKANGIPNITETQNYVAKILGGKGGTVMADQPNQPQQQPQGLLGGILGGQGVGGALGLSDDFRDRLKMGLLLGSDPRAFAPMVSGMQQAAKERRAVARTTAQANATADYLERIGQTDLANLLRQGGIDARTALSAGASKTKDTADIREYNLAVSQGYKGTFADWQQTGKKRTEVGTIPQGYQLVEGRNDAGEIVLRLEPIKGGPADVTESEEVKRTQELRTAGIITGAIDKIQDKLKTTTLPIAGFAGAQLSKIAGTNAYDVGALVQTIRANIGFDKLQAMRDASPTGGALGQVSNQEIAFLQSTLNNLDQGQTTAQFTEQLNLLENMYNKVIRKLNAYPDEAKRLAGYSDIGIVDDVNVEPSGGATDDDLLKKYGD